MKQEEKKQEEQANQETKKQVCCICGKEFEEWGNNPDPLGDVEESCCDGCNWLVITARMMVVHWQQKGFNVKFEKLQK